MTTKRMLVCDIETDGLLDKMTTIHCAVAKDYVSGEVMEYRPGEIFDFCELLEGNVVIGHNWIGFDSAAIHKWKKMNCELYAYEEMPQPKMVIDTLVMSRLLNPDRERPEGLPQRVGPHSLKAWGYRLEMLKGEYGEQDNAWVDFNEDMLAYCRQDVNVTAEVYKALLKEMQDD